MNNFKRNNDMATENALPETGFLRLPTVLRVFPVSKSTWWAGIKSGKYPRAFKLGPRISGWRAEDIRALIEATE